MRNLSVVAVFTVVMMSVVGCGGVEAEQHELSRPGEQVGTAALASQQSRGFISDGQNTQVEGQVSAQQVQQATLAETCSGSCNATTCSCYGSYECCLAGCVACWEVLDTLEPATAP
ncbi:hypothetical protein CYFUS_000108 [Cystobacter fuscus]|uniref:Lipoprotein n=1 Tax=Cystobacter fuscus TaxID=43 RepID=A0A250IU73_9BACT|nr:hypothetical protein [Cystobacter fuscus]ATB34701.1 hypothetical protein CYFUS_000108 [Cystobacter fuscus]